VYLNLENTTSLNEYKLTEIRAKCLNENDIGVQFTPFFAIDADELLMISKWMKKIIVK